MTHVCIAYKASQIIYSFGHGERERKREKEREKKCINVCANDAEVVLCSLIFSLSRTHTHEREKRSQMQKIQRHTRQTKIHSKTKQKKLLVRQKTNKNTLLVGCMVRYCVHVGLFEHRIEGRHFYLIHFSLSLSLNFLFYSTPTLEHNFIFHFYFPVFAFLFQTQQFFSGLFFSPSLSDHVLLLRA